MKRFWYPFRLAITREIVVAHGGSIEVRNNPEGGATFAVTLRAVESGAADDAAAVLQPDRAVS